MGAGTTLSWRARIRSRVGGRPALTTRWLRRASQGLSVLISEMGPMHVLPPGLWQGVTSCLLKCSTAAARLCLLPAAAMAELKPG